MMRQPVGKIEARSETVAGALQDNYFDAIVTVRFSQEIVKQATHVAAHGVELFGPIESDCGDRTCALILHNIVWHQSSPQRHRPAKGALSFAREHRWDGRRVQEKALVL